MPTGSRKSPTKSGDPDRIILYRTTNSGEWRWTRRASGNNEIIGQSTEGYVNQRAALDNIERTQKQPYTIEVKS